MLGATVVGLGLTVASTLALAGTAATAAPSLRATYDVQDARGPGYEVEYTVSNVGTVSVTGWKVEVDIPAGTDVRRVKNAMLTRAGNRHFVFTNKHKNQTIAPGRAQFFSFVTVGQGRPLNCKVNGQPCTGPVGSPSPTGSKSPSPSTKPSTSPSASKSPSPSTSPSVKPSTSPSASKSPSPSVKPSTSPSASTPASPSASPSTMPLPSGSPSSSAPTSRLINVATVGQLKSALAGARAGDTIHLADGTYNGAFYGLATGTPTAPITLTGSRSAVLTNTSNACDPNIPPNRPVSYCGYGFHLNRASYWKLVGFSVGAGNKGIVFDSSSHNVIDGVQVSNINQEGIHLRAASSDNVVKNTFIHDTGKTDPGFGEGLYFGSATSNWDKYGENNGTGPDRSDRNQALTNQFGPNVTSEHIDVKEGTVNGLISGNNFDGRGISGQHFSDSWVDVKGSFYLLSNNVGTFVAGTGVFADGYETHQQVPGDGCGNVWRSNKSDLGGVGSYAVRVTNQSGCSGKPNVVYSSNTVSNAKSGLTNIAVTPG
jgi:parallel beta-helix repeat protein